MTWQDVLLELAELNRMQAHLARRLTELNEAVYAEIREDTTLCRSKPDSRDAELADGVDPLRPFAVSDRRG
jgi:hypothetical protein